MKTMRLKWIFLCLLITPAWGYRFTQDFALETGGFYWQKLPINITVVETDPNRKAMLEALSQSALMDWEDSTGLSLWDWTNSGTKNIIRWSTNFARETNMDPATVLAVAIRYTDGPYFAKTEIVINGNHVYNQNQTLLRTTLTHELGHTMGLDHSEIGSAVMAPTLQPWYTGLHPDDVQGMSAAHAEMMKRQQERYVSRYAYKAEESQPQALSCGSIGIQGPSMGLSGIFSLIGGILMSLLGKIFRWFKSRP
jgi:predicted SprT family Zn-dependent metalloprotease